MMSVTSSQLSVSCVKKRVKVYRHEPYAASLITPASPAEAALVCCHQRSPKSPASSYATSSPARSILDAALPSAQVAAYPSHHAAASLALPMPMAHPAHTAVWVAFKYGRKPFVAAFQVCIGEMVIVEGDRGIDLGIVDDACTTPLPEKVLFILRRATAEDTTQHHRRTVKEQEALQTMRSLATQVHCPTHVEDAMFQLDGKKITVIISRASRSFVDFRRLQRSLFDVYRCRIWFAYLDEIQETMSTEVTRPLRRGQRRCSSSNEARDKKILPTASCTAAM
ncbi:PSP1 C-terminal conserved region containing protein, putative [Leishmania donovani]|uniref:PSP1 C-terminal conserved region containing protein, putative n=1 Tax=Leishmania donovani TaxID=5661 RepID=A0A3Q8IJZ1_LEIDO|nr:PSP1 C-terminal conserved region containing protein, putative [Leishmania donovani]